MLATWHSSSLWPLQKNVYPALTVVNWPLFTSHAALRTGSWMWYLLSSLARRAVYLSDLLDFMFSISMSMFHVGMIRRIIFAKVCVHFLVFWQQGSTPTFHSKKARVELSEKDNKRPFSVPFSPQKVSSVFLKKVVSTTQRTAKLPCFFSPVRRSSCGLGRLFVKLWLQLSVYLHLMLHHLPAATGFWNG